MPALNYKKQFVPMVKEGSKRQSIRAFRNSLFKPGQMLMHYYGMRTKHCTKIIEDTVCTRVQTIFILSTGDVYLYPSTDQEQAEAMLIALEALSKIGKDGSTVELERLTDYEKDKLAWKDGFRTGSCCCAGSFQLMFDWFKEVHALPFVGQLITWNPLDDLPF